MTVIRYKRHFAVLILAAVVLWLATNSRAVSAGANPFV